MHHYKGFLVRIKMRDDQLCQFSVQSSPSQRSCTKWETDKVGHAFVSKVRFEMTKNDAPIFHKLQYSSFEICLTLRQNYIFFFRANFPQYMRTSPIQVIVAQTTGYVIIRFLSVLVSIPSQFPSIINHSIHYLQVSPVDFIPNACLILLLLLSALHSILLNSVRRR